MMLFEPNWYLLGLIFAICLIAKLLKTRITTFSNWVCEGKMVGLAYTSPRMYPGPFSSSSKGLGTKLAYAMYDTSCVQLAAFYVLVG